MSYTVDWKRRAEAQLAALWIRANNKEAVVGYAEQNLAATFIRQSHAIVGELVVVIAIERRLEFQALAFWLRQPPCNLAIRGHARLS